MTITKLAVGRWSGSPVILAFALSFSSCSDWRERAQVLPDIPVFTLAERWRVDGNAAILGPVSWLVVTPSGDAVVGQPLDGRVAVLDSTGRRIGAFGSSGRQAGQFTSMTRAGTLGDSLWVYDARLRRVTVITPELQLGRIFTWPPPGFNSSEDDPGAVSIPYLWAITPGGDIVHSLYRPRRTFPAIPESVAAGRAAERGRRVIVNHPEPGDVVYSGRHELRNTRIFPIDPIFSPGSDGRAFVFVDVASDGPEAGTFEVTRYGSAGDTIFVRRHPFYPVPVSPEAADAEVEARARALARRESVTPGVTEAFRKVVEVSPVYPPIEEVVVGSDGSTWIRMRPLVEDRSEYYILGPAGDLVGQVSLAGTVRIAAATLERAWGIDTDPMGVSSVVGYQLSPDTPFD